MSIEHFLTLLDVLGAAGGHAQEVAPLNQVTVPDVNMLRLLDGMGSGAWPEVQVTEPERKEALQALGKVLFWNMQGLLVSCARRPFCFCKAARPCPLTSTKWRLVQSLVPSPQENC